ncbi:MAG: hypothetical protein WC656_01730 [Sulfurimonas sp.]
MNKLAKSFSILALSTSLFADCQVDYAIMYTIAKNERHANRNIGYPYLISFNSEKDANRARQELELNWLDKRTVDCGEAAACKSDLSDINAISITNLDLGAYQINQKSFNFEDADEYFVLKNSYENACGIVYAHYEETKEWTWRTIARYHSKTEKYNRIYAMNLAKNYSKMKGKEI